MTIELLADERKLLQLRPAFGDEVHARRLDPLGATAWLERLPELNAKADVEAIGAALQELLLTPERAQALTTPEALAAMRDLGMLMCSLRRHDVEPAVWCPALGPALQALAARTGMLARDTIYHYGPFNPRGPRQRMFTGDENESRLIECVRRAAPVLELCTVQLQSLSELSPDDAEYAKVCASAREYLRTMVEIISFAKRNVSAVFFAQSLRPYFQPVHVGGAALLGPAAAHIPLWLVDHLLWGSDCEDATFQGFQAEAARHSPARLRAVLTATEGSCSLLTRLAERAEASDSPSVQQSVSAFTEMLSTILEFRGKHRTLAMQSYAPGVGLYPVGSGGYSVEMLTHMVQLTRTKLVLLRAWMEAHRPAGGCPFRKADAGSYAPGNR